MKITKAFLKRHDACIDGYRYWVEAKKPNLFDFLEHCLADNHFDYANWLVVKCMIRTQRLKYSVFAREFALPTFEKEYPEDSQLRKLIEAAKKGIRNNTLKNRKAAAYAAFATKLAEYAFAAKPSYSATALVDAAYAAAHVYTASSAEYASAAKPSYSATAFATAYAAAHVYTASSAEYAAAAAAIKKIQGKIIRYGIKIMKEKRR
jgi:hypothetical protein